MNKILYDNIELLERSKKHEDAFLELIKQRLGIVIHSHQKVDLHNTIIAACRKFDFNPESYLQFLQNCPNNSMEFIHLVTGITIGETYFFRDNRQMQLLKEKLLPEIIQSKREKNEYTIRIWSAACSTGEDIYTIGMMLCELLPDYKRWRLQLMGTDINTISLQKAALGSYGQWSMRTIQDYYKTKYFTQTGNHFQLKNTILELVKFSYLNLNDSTYPSILNGTARQDLIVCCNVLIYFDTASIRLLMNKLENCLIPGGFLILGASDPIILANTSLLQHQTPGHYFSRPKLEVNLPQERIEAITAPKINVLKPIKVKAPSSDNNPINSHPTVDLALISQLMQRAQWKKALDVIETYLFQGKKTTFLLNAKATALANSGKLLPAITSCNESILMDTSNKVTYFINAMILLELNKLIEAESLLRKAIFLDHRFVEAHYQLGLLLLRCKNQEAGLKCLRNALSIAKTEPPTCMISEFGSLNFSQLVTILENEITIHTNRCMLSAQEKKNGK